jgi:large subunit ribosomal protein L3
MAKGHKPKAGSRAFWPRKRAKRAYPRLKHSRESERVAGKIEGTKPIAFGGYKAGMTQVLFEDNRKGTVTQGQEMTKPVSVIECPPLFVMAVKLYKRRLDSYESMGTVWAKDMKKDVARKLDIPKGKTSQVSNFDKQLDKIADVRLIVHTQPRESGVSKKKPEVFELGLSGTVEEKWNYAKGKLGKDIDISEVFGEGEYVDVKAVSKGKGFQGVVKRFGVTIRSRKNKEKRRHIGTMGPVTPARVLPGAVPQAGQLGFQTRTEYNKRVLKLGNDGLKIKGGFLNYGEVKKNYVLVEGSVPGPKKRLVFLRKSFRKPDNKEPVEIKSVNLNSHQ